MGVMTVFLLAGRVALAGEENRAPELRDLRQAARQEFAGLAAEPPQGEEKRQFERVRRILDVLARDGISLAEVLGRDDAQAAVARQGISRVFTAARRTAANPLVDMADRGAAVAILGRGPDRQDEDLRCLASLLIPQTPLELQLAAVEATNRSPHNRVSELLLSHWTNHGPKVHAAAVAVLLWRDPWLGALEEESASRPELAAALDWARRDIALRHPAAEVRARAERLQVTRAVKPEIRKSLDRFFPALSMQGDAARGKKVFIEATCANCHKVEDVGRHIGPDLSRLVDRSPRTLLVDTIDPNRVVDHQVLEYTVVTTNGLQISGMLFDESGDRITLADLKGELQIVLRKDLDELVSHHRSQMPEGLEAKFTLPQMADLVAFLVRTVPVVDGQVPRAAQSGGSGRAGPQGLPTDSLRATRDAEFPERPVP
jgi:putative heme-binding domain-containing protein